TWVSFTDDEYLERVWQIRSTAGALARRRSRRGQENPVRLFVERNRACPAFGRDVFGDLPLSAGLLHDGQGAISVRAEGITRPWIECPAVGSRTDGRGRDDFSGVGIGYRHDPVAAHGEELAILRVDRQA